MKDFRSCIAGASDSRNDAGAGTCLRKRRRCLTAPAYPVTTSGSKTGGLQLDQLYLRK